MNADPSGAWHEHLGRLEAALDAAWHALGAGTADAATRALAALDHLPLPDAPLPASQAPRARALLGRVRDLAAATGQARARVGEELATIRRLDPRPPGPPRYLDDVV